MNEGINLLKPNPKSTSAFIYRINKTRILMIGFLFIVSVCSVILFILVAISPLPTLQKQEQALRQQLAQSKNDIVKYELVNERIQDITSILHKRQSVDQIVTMIRDKMTNDSNVTSLTINSKEITVTVESQSLKSLNTFLSGLVSYVQDKKTFSKVTLVDLTTDKASNAYAATVSLALL